MSGEPTTQPPAEDKFVWFREDRVFDALQQALNEAVETHGNSAKAIAWDVRSSFRNNVRGAA